jgi:hypothetical protein
LKGYLNSVKVLFQINRPNASEDPVADTRFNRILKSSKRRRAFLSAALVASTLAGLIILANDTYLWNAAPTHAYGLEVFSSLAFAFALWLWLRPRPIAVLAIILLGLLQLGAMVTDMLIGASAGSSQEVFGAYLMSDNAFIMLLVMQAIIIGIGIASAIQIMKKLGRHQ